MVGIIGYRILPINEKKEDAPGGESFFCMEYEAYAFTTKVAEPYAFSGLPFSSYSVVYPRISFSVYAQYLHSG